MSLATVESEPAPHSPTSEWTDGGRTALPAALGYGAGPVLFLTTASLFIRPTIQATGWTTTQVLISPWLSLLFALFGPIVGRLCDRRGVKLVAAFGLIPYIVLLVLFAILPLNMPTYYGLAALMGFCGSFGYAVTYNRAVSAWFDKSAGKAFGLVGAGGAAMPFFAIPLVSLAIYLWGWRSGYSILAAFALLVAVPAALVGIKSRSIRARQAAGNGNTADVQPRATLRDITPILRTPRFWIFALAVALSTGGANAFLANVQPILLDAG